MSNEVKAGLFLGIGLVIAAAVLFFQKEPNSASPAATVKPAVTVRNDSYSKPATAALLPPGPLPRPEGKELEGIATSRKPVNPRP